ncbi:MAG: hypothetical protein HOD97_03975 [Candidatus Marinimicrobia bacterium]|jgi:predicted dienelactone hydrolase|nr:hypothetical protein [Candidatus Neomarinimicrobiota bacterium]MBT3828346.1 hypothetical protein [Candidatus Neomarinimicrobiota bacterium]MBT3997600.1 hypothetical protein [Candidatus Neomarinimicrobiota bacterium]MBT4280761.1 hypothetical protein [Candidatus Neomarinimicrobiota bacterium]MBT4569422.1 hypothetical protein [Candidatus Neomarinimicrobiota bacterium]
MVPAYGLLGYLFLRIKLKNKISIGTSGKSLLVLWIVIAILFPLVVSVPILPKPSGPFSIGTRVFQWTDSTRLEWFTDKNPNDLRKLVAQVWYPAIDDGEKNAPYMDHMNQRAEMLGNAGGVPGFLIEQLGLVNTHSLLNAKPVSSSADIPLILFSHGITGQRSLHTILFEHLASFGYCVVALDHPYDSNLTIFPDGTSADYRSNITGNPDSLAIRRKQLNTRVADIKFIANKMEQMNQIDGEFYNVLNMDKVAIVGYSYGGATAIQTTFEDSRFKVCIVLDAWTNPVPYQIIDKGIDKPFLSLSRPRWDNNPNRSILLDTIISSGNLDQYNFVIMGTEHLDYTDTPVLNPFSDYVLGTGSIDNKRVLDLVNQFVRGFLEKYLIQTDEDFYSIHQAFPEAIIQ